jgi:predicted RNA-binding protein YlqC (UPF0109 family)
MVLKLLKKALGREKGAVSAAGIPEDDDERIIEFVRYVVCGLVDTPEKVDIRIDNGKDQLAIKVNCDKPDMGKVIGRRGRTVSSIRTLVAGAARRSDKTVTVDIVD